MAQAALQGRLPEGVSPMQVRGALSAVMDRSLSMPGTFTDEGWLNPGMAGHQPSLGEGYISRGSLYLCCAALLPLGLPEDSLFWSGPDEDWTGKKVWAGQDVPADHGIRAASRIMTRRPWTAKLKRRLRKRS